MSTSWYTTHLKGINDLLTRLEKYELQGSFERELDPKELTYVVRNLVMEIRSMQNQIIAKDTEIGSLKIELEKIKKG